MTIVLQTVCNTYLQAIYNAVCKTIVHTVYKAVCNTLGDAVLSTVRDTVYNPASIVLAAVWNTVFEPIVDCAYNMYCRLCVASRPLDTVFQSLL